MIHNFNLITPFLQFRSDDDFFFCQILQRKKDQEIDPEDLEKSGQFRSVRLLNTYYIDSLNKFKRYESRIIDECNQHNARAYINLNRRSYEKVALQTLKKVVDSIMNREYRYIKRAYNSSCGQLSAEKEEKKWVLDFDFKPKSVDWEIEIKGILSSIPPVDLKEKVYGFIPTPNGLHVITRPFDVRYFKKDFPDVDIKKNNPTILYVP